MNNGNTDIKIQSIDGVVFDLHRAMLSAYAGAFPGPEIDTAGEVVVLSEPANVLRICFDFIYPKRHPDLEDIKEFELLAAVAEAVGKYEIFSAYNTCNTRLRAFLSSYPSEIFVYAIKHDHPKLMNETAQYLARSPFTSILKQLPPAFMVPWSLYRDAWTAVFKDAGKHITQIPPSSLHYCHLNPSSPWQSSLSDSDTSRICGTCRSLLYTWVATWEEIDTVSALNDTLQAACDKGIRECLAAVLQLKEATMGQPNRISSAFKSSNSPSYVIAVFLKSHLSTPSWGSLLEDMAHVHILIVEKGHRS